MKGILYFKTLTSSIDIFDNSCLGAPACSLQCRKAYSQSSGTDWPWCQNLFLDALASQAEPFVTDWLTHWFMVSQTSSSSLFLLSFTPSDQTFIKQSDPGPNPVHVRPAKLGAFGQCTHCDSRPAYANRGKKWRTHLLGDVGMYCKNRRRQNLGIAKKGEGGRGEPCKDIFGGFAIVHSGQLKVVMDPKKWWLFPQKWPFTLNLLTFPPKYINLISQF